MFERVYSAGLAVVGVRVDSDMGYTTELPLSCDLVYHKERPPRLVAVHPAVNIERALLFLQRYSLQAF
jgi:hypothetical protein